ncbi:LpqN/LpqT family lipoprotein [Mycobacterium sp. GA-2829]|uniref:LpqN/LpqT family lipoprotein n=1 Tax=Mycobacterium sp. GA-2829 TaxID=1772283 RepID=UPI00073FE9F4|nr:LpqN/LpqT family lipoprotein [Mycobacterium sp. GA-2829]KUI29198.1 hypothetical protein AU194_20165 [Mycobacterium sp. GA-2829]
MTARTVATAAAATLIALAAAACGTQSATTPPAAVSVVADASACAPATSALEEIPTRVDTDPAMSIPRPAGWERFTMMDSDLVRYMLVNRDLVADQFAPNVVVTIESIPGNESADSVLTKNRTAIETLGGATDLAYTPTTVCGQPAERITYTGAPQGTTPARPIITLATVIHTGGRTFGIAVTAQATRPDNPTYQRDVEAILTGFQVLAATTANPA